MYLSYREAMIRLIGGYTLGNLRFAYDMDFMTVTERKVHKILDKLVKQKVTKELGSIVTRADVFH